MYPYIPAGGVVDLHEAPGRVEDARAGGQQPRERCQELRVHPEGGVGGGHFVSSMRVRLSSTGPGGSRRVGSVAEGNEDVPGPAGRMAAWDGGGNVLCVSSDGPRGVEFRREPRLLSIGLLEPELDFSPRGLRPRRPALGRG